MRNIYIYTLIVLLFSIISTNSYAQMSLQDKKTARSIWLKGFDYYGKAKTNTETGQYKLALDQYQKALNLFEKIKAAYPDWNKELIDYRLNVCSSKIVEVKASLSKSNIKSTKLEIDQENLVLKQKIKKLEKELSEAKNQLEITFASLDVAKRESERNDKVVKQVGDLLKEKINLTHKCALLSEQLEDLKAQKGKNASAQVDKEDLTQALIQLEAIKKDRNELIKVLKEKKKKFEALMEERNQLKFNIQKFETAGEDKEKQKTNTLQELADLKGKLQKLQENKQKLEDQLTGMRKKQAEKEITIEQLKSDLETARSNSPNSNNAIIEKLTNDKDLLSVSLENANEKILHQTNEIKELKKSTANAKKRIEVLGDTLAKIDRRRAGIEVDMEILNRKLAESSETIARQNKKLKSQQESYESLKKDFGTYAKTAQLSKKDQKDFTKLIEELVEEKKSKAALKMELESKNNDYAEMENQLTTLQKQLAEANLKIKQSNERLKELENQPINLESLNDDGIDELKSKNAKMSVELDTLRIANTELITKVNSLNDKMSELNKSIEEKQELLNKAQELCEQKLNVDGESSTGPTQSAEYMALLNENDQLKVLAEKQKATIANIGVKLKESIKNLEQKNIEIEGIKKKFKARSDVMNSPQYAKLTLERDNLKSQVAEYNKQLKTINIKNEELNKGIASRDEQIKNLNIKLASKGDVDIKSTPEYLILLGKKNVLSKILNDQKSVIEKMEAKIKKISVELSEKDKNLLALKEVKGKENNILSQKMQIEKALKEKTDEIEKLKLVIAKIKKQFESVNSKLANSKDSHSSIMESEKTLKTKNEQLQIALDSKEQEIENIKETLNELKTELTNKETELKQLKSSHTNNEDIESSTKYIAMVNENDQLQTMLEDKQKDFAAMKTAVSDLEKENAKLLNLKQAMDEEKASKAAEKEGKEKTSKEIAKLLTAAAESEKSGKNDAAVWYYETVLEQAPDNAVALAKLGIMKALKGDFKDAEPLLTKATAQDRQNLDALLALTFCHINQRKYYKALSTASFANAVNSNNATVHRYMGIICSYLGWYDVAETEFRKAFRINPKSAETAYNAAVNLVKADISKINIAKQWYDKAVELGIERDIVLEKLFKKKLQEAKLNKKKSSHRRKTKKTKKTRKRKTKKK